MFNKYSVEKWTGAIPPREEEIHQILKEQGLSGFTWSNSPGDIYEAHAHLFYKVIYVVRGSIRFGLLSEGKQVTLNTGDRLDLPTETSHDAVVGP